MILRLRRFLSSSQGLGRMSKRRHFDKQRFEAQQAEKALEAQASEGISHEQWLLFKAIESDKLSRKKVKTALRLGAKIDAACNKHGFHPIHALASNSLACTPLDLDWLISLGANHAALDAKGQNILHICARNKNHPLFKMTLARWPELASEADFMGLYPLNKSFNFFASILARFHINSEHRESLFQAMNNAARSAALEKLISELFMPSRGLATHTLKSDLQWALDHGARIPEAGELKLLLTAIQEQNGSISEQVNEAFFYLTSLSEQAELEQFDSGHSASNSSKLRRSL